MTELMSPHFTNPTLTWLTIILMLLISLYLIASYIFKHNIASLIIGVGTFFMALGYFCALLPFYLYPNDLVTLGWYSNVVSEAIWYIGYASFALVIIAVQFNSIPRYVALIFLILGLITTTISGYYYLPPTQLSDGSVDFHRLFIADLLPFSFGLFLAFGLGKFFLSVYRSKTYQVGATFIVLGIALVAIPQPLATAVNATQLQIVFQSISIIGLIFILIGLWRANSEQKSKK